MGEYICEWCGETFDISQRLAAHTRWNHKDKPRIKSPEGKRMLGIEEGGYGGSKVVYKESREIADDYGECFTNAGERLLDELKDIGKKTNLKTIVNIYENGNIDSPEHMNHCLKRGGVSKQKRALILESHYGINPTSILNQDSDGIYEAPPIEQKESPVDYIHEIARMDFELEEIERQTELLRQKPRRQPPQQPNPDNGDEGKVEIPLPSPFDPSQPLKDAKGNIVTTLVDPQQIMMQQQFGGSNLKGDKTETTDTLDAIIESKPQNEDSSQNIENDPAFIALKEQVDAQIPIRDRILEENKALRELPTVNETKRECVQIESPIESEENRIEDTKMDAIKYLNRTLKQKDTQLRIEQQVLE